MITGLEVVRGDITTLEVDAVVNAANEALAPGGGVCGAIHRVAGPALAQACREAAPCPTGQARITPGFGLRARHVIHAVGPVWQGGGHGEAEALAACYRSVLELCRRHGLDSVAVPAISAGIYGYPREAACRLAVETLAAGLRGRRTPRRVLLVAYDAPMEAALRAALQREEGGEVGPRGEGGPVAPR